MAVALTNWWQSSSCGTTFYRVSRPSEKESDVLSGRGAFYNLGGRFNGVHQATVYLSGDPLVAITEAAYYQARKWQSAIGGCFGAPVPRPANPLVSFHKLWQVELDPIPNVVVLQSNEAWYRFTPWEREYLNPSHDDENLRDLADRIRHACAHDPGATPKKPVALGIEYPSVRTPCIGGYVPAAHAFFKAPFRGSSVQGKIAERWTLKLEFCDDVGASISATNFNRVNWLRARFALGPARGGSAHSSVPRFPANPQSQGYRQQFDYWIEIRYA
jgi:hypothetical protein